MANLQASVAVRNARADAVETAIGAAGILRIYDLTAGAPANCAAAITATLLVEETLPSDWMDPASAGAKAKAGTWQAVGVGAGTADFYRIYASDGTTCHLQDTVTATGGGGGMTLDNAVIAVDQVVTITSFGWTEPNA